MVEAEAEQGGSGRRDGTGAGRPAGDAAGALPGRDARLFEAHVVKRLAEQKKYDAPTRELFLRLVADNYCREAAIDGLRNCKMTDAEAMQVERLLTRKSRRRPPRRRRAAGVSGGPGGARQRRPAARLEGRAAARGGPGNAPPAGRRQAAGGRGSATAPEFQGRAKKVTKDETVHLEAILDEARTAETLDDALGLLDPSRRTAPLEPKKKAVSFCTPAARKILLALDDLIHQQREEKVFLPDYAAELDEEDDEDAAEKTPGDDKPAGDAKPKGKEELLGNVRWNFPVPRAALPLERDLQRLPMREVWEKWWSQRPAGLRDDDGMEVIRALFLKAFTTDTDGDLVDSDADLDEDEEGKFTYRDKLYRQMLNGVKPLKRGTRSARRHHRLAPAHRPAQSRDRLPPRRLRNRHGHGPHGQAGGEGEAVE